MVKPHAKRTDLQCPDYLIKEWQTGDKNAMADLLQKMNWDKDKCSYCLQGAMVLGPI